MRWVLSRHVPPVKKLLLVESGPRPIAEKFITQFRELYGEELPIDLLTCLPSDPPGLTANGVRGEVFRVIDCHDHRTRWRLLRQIRAKRHPVTAIICADSHPGPLENGRARTVHPVTAIICSTAAIVAPPNNSFSTAPAGGKAPTCKRWPRSSLSPSRSRTCWLMRSSST